MNWKNCLVRQRKEDKYDDKFGFVGMMEMKIEDFISYEQPTNYIVHSDQYVDNGCTPVLTAGQSFILGYTDEEDGIYDNDPVVIFDDFTTSVQYVDFPFKVKSSAIKILRNKENANIKFCYYLLSWLQEMPPNHKRQWISTTSQIDIILPSLCEQEEIVKKIEAVSNIIKYRNEELNKLDDLIKARFVEMFGDPATNPMRWSETTIGDECFYIKDGPHKSLPDIGKENGGHPFISVRNIVNGYIDFSTARYISDEDYANAIKKCHPEKGDMLYSKGGTTGIAKLIDIDEEFANWVHVAVLKFDKSKLNGIFFENMLNGDYCFEQSQRLTKGIANRDLVLSAMAQIKMYRPPMEIQKQFADFVNQVDKSKFVYY